MAQDKTFEYVAISVVKGDVTSITPSTSGIESWLISNGPALKIDIGVAVNKMAEDGFRLGCPALIVLGEVHPANASYIVFMERESNSTQKP